MGCEGCSRAILLVFNIIFFLVGAAALGVGIFVIVDGEVFLKLLGNIPNSSVYGKLIADAAYIIIGGGAAIFLIAFFGCCGAWKKNKCMLITYSIIMGVILVLEVGCVVVAYFFYDKVVAVLSDDLSKALNSSYDSTFTETPTSGEYTYKPGNILSKGIDAIQIEFQCCGVNNASDYKGNFPASCCPSDKTGADLKTLVDTLWAEEMTTYTTNAACVGNDTYIQDVKGCVDEIKNYVQEKSIIFIAIGGGTLGIQLLLIILSCCLVCAIRSEENKH